MGCVCLPGCGGPSQASFPSGADPDSVFAADILPMLEFRCEGCHFPGGEQYASLPFDDSRVVVVLGDGMLSQFENDEDRALMRAYLRLAAPPETP